MFKQNEKAVTYCEPMQFNASDKQINPVLINNEPYFVAAEVCEILGLGNPTESLRNLESDEKLTSVLLRAGQKRSVNLINESGLYNLIFQSRKPEAKSFRKWVTSEVLPAIRKSGKYQLKGKSPRDSEFVDLRHIPYEFRKINESQVRVIPFEDIDWYNINDIQRGIGANTTSCQIVKQLNSGNRTMALKILIFGNTHPAWFTPITGVKLILSGSRKMKHNKQSIQQLQLTIGGLV